MLCYYADAFAPILAIWYSNPCYGVKGVSALILTGKPIIKLRSLLAVHWPNDYEIAIAAPKCYARMIRLKLFIHIKPPVSESNLFNLRYNSLYF